MKKAFTLFALVFFCSRTSFAISPITGPTTVCAGSSITLSNADPGGVWVSGTVSVATIGSLSGIVNGITAGTTTITYTTGAGSSILDITVNPIPVLSSSLTPPTLCDSQIFNYTPMSPTMGTTFMWNRALITGIAIPASSGSGNPNEQMVNISALPIPVIYTYTLTANGCTGTQNVTATVNPTPKMSSALTLPPMCDATQLNYIATSATPGALFSWNRPAVANITPPTSFVSAGAGEIHETLFNSTQFPIIVTYNYRLQIAGCINLSLEKVTVTINGCTHAAVEDITSREETVRIFPNPSHGNSTIELPSGDNTIIITDLLGKILQTYSCQTKAGQPVSLGLENTPPGTYIVEVITGSRSYRQKLVIW